MEVIKEKQFAISQYEQLLQLYMQQSLKIKEQEKKIEEMAQELKSNSQLEITAIQKPNFENANSIEEMLRIMQNKENQSNQRIQTLEEQNKELIECLEQEKSLFQKIVQANKQMQLDLSTSQQKQKDCSQCITQIIDKYRNEIPKYVKVTQYNSFDTQLQMIEQMILNITAKIKEKDQKLLDQEKIINRIQMQYEDCQGQIEKQRDLMMLEFQKTFSDFQQEIIKEFTIKIQEVKSQRNKSNSPQKRKEDNNNQPNNQFFEQINKILNSENKIKNYEEIIAQFKRLIETIRLFSEEINELKNQLIFEKEKQIRIQQESENQLKEQQKIIEKKFAQEIEDLSGLNLKLSEQLKNDSTRRQKRLSNDFSINQKQLDQIKQDIDNRYQHQIQQQTQTINELQIILQQKSSKEEECLKELSQLKSQIMAKENQLKQQDIQKK